MLWPDKSTLLGEFLVRLHALCVYTGKGLKGVNSKKKMVHLRKIIYSISLSVFQHWQYRFWMKHNQQTASFPWGFKEHNGVRILKQPELHLSFIKSSGHWKHKAEMHQMGRCYPQGPSGESELPSNSSSFKSFLMSMPKRRMLPSLPSGTLDEEHGFPHFKGEQCTLAVSVWPPQTKTWNCPQHIALCPSQGAHSARSELPAKHTVDLEAMGDNPSNEELPDIWQGS